MATLVAPVPHTRPGKAQVYLRTEAVALLERAIAIYGQPIYPTGSRSGGRTYADQLLLWERHQAGGPVAAHPDRGPRPHMRYGAIDIDDQGARAAMRAAGWLATEPSEWWHFEHPDARSWPIVTDPTTTIEEETPVTFRIKQAENGGRITLTNLVTGLSTHVRRPEHVDLLKRFRDADETDRMYSTELELCEAYVAATWPWPTPGGIDQEKLIDELAAAFFDELKERL